MMWPMKVTHSVRYDASVEDVYAMLSDPAFRERTTRAQGATSVNVTIDGGHIEIDFRRPNDDIPSFARKFAGGAELHATQTEEWADDDYSATMTVDTEGVPAGVVGTRTLIEDGDGTIDQFEGDATARIPLVAGKIEKLIAEKFVEGWNNEHAQGVAWLGGNR